MNKYIAWGLVALVAVVGVGFLFANKPQQTGQDFPGGITPTNVMTASAGGGLTGNGYVAPVGSLAVNAQNGLSVGGSDQYHGLSGYVTASGTPSAAVTLGAFGNTTSSATTTVTLPESAGLSIGAICSGSTATTTVYVSGCVLTSTNGVTGTAMVAYSNLTGATLAVPTSTVLRISFDQLPY
jgi:hypothetical protein